MFMKGLPLKFVNPPLVLGGYTEAAASQVDGAGVSLARNYGAALSNRDNALEINADTGKFDLAGDTYMSAIKGRLCIGTTQTNASLMGIIGKLDVGPSVNLSANYFALRGHLNFWGDTSISGTSHVGAVSAYVENEGTTTIGAGQFLSGVDIYQVGAPTNSGTNPAIHIRSSSAAAAWQYGVYVANSATTTGVYVGTATLGLDIQSKSRIGTHDWGVGVTGISIAATDPLFQVAGKISGANVANGMYASTYSQLACKYSQNRDVSMAASWNELVIYGGTITLAGSSNYYAVWGNAIAVGTVTSSSGNFAALNGSLTIPAGFTNTGSIAGCKVDGILHTTAVTNNSGIIAAFAIGEHNDPYQGDWQYGLYMPASTVTTGMYIGACTTGIKVVGIVSTAIDLQAVVPYTNAGGDQANLLRAGTAGSKMLFETNYQQGCLFHLKTTGGRLTGLEMNVYTEYEGDNPQTDKGLRGIESIARSLVNDSGGAPDMYSICGSVQILSGRDAPLAGSKMVSGYFSYSVDAAATSYAGSAFVLYLETGSGKNMAQGDFIIKMISNNAAATPLTAFMNCAGGANYVMQFDNVMTPANGMAWNYQGVVSGTQAGWIKTRVWNGSGWTDGYIALYPNGATS